MNPNFRESNLADRVGSLFILGMQEVIGLAEAETILANVGLPGADERLNGAGKDFSFPANLFEQIIDALEKKYGAQAARGIALRSGRACFKYLVWELGSEIGFADTNYRLMPLKKKLITGSDKLARILSSQMQEIITCQEEPSRYVWRIESNKQEKPVCYIISGLIQEFSYWVSGGKQYKVQSVECVSKGDPSCMIVVDKTPLD
jgi:predicted hydrocarbon binding protein